ncbi:MAG: TetR family transcriptional regulator [Emcibacter sp.]|nr:TetR family transcriptional regulator [Emcibacter sp.]
MTAEKPAQQTRAQATIDRITDAAIKVIARDGISRTTHRKIAEMAEVSLASITYHFATKEDILNESSRRLLTNYLHRFENAEARLAANNSKWANMEDLIAQVLTYAFGKFRTETMAWQEIMLEAGRSEESQALARDWHTTLFNIWHRISKHFQNDKPALNARSAIDLITGLIFILSPLKVSQTQVKDLFYGKKTLSNLQRATSAKPDTRNDIDLCDTPLSPKKIRTRGLILKAAISILTEHGASAVTHRSVAHASGLSNAVPIYHFKSIDGLLHEAQITLYKTARERYRKGMAGVNYEKLTVDQLVDLTNTIFIRETTEYGKANIAKLSVELESYRKPDLQMLFIGSSILEQDQAWHRLLTTLSPTTPPQMALFMQAQFIGKMIRLIATGTNTSDLITSREEFEWTLKAALSGSYWFD